MVKTATFFFVPKDVYEMKDTFLGGEKVKVCSINTVVWQEKTQEIKRDQNFVYSCACLFSDRRQIRYFSL